MPSQSKDTISITFTLDWTCHALLCLGDVFETNCEDWAVVSIS
jgi:hypothetical protein